MHAKFRAPSRFQTCLQGMSGSWCSSRAAWAAWLTPSPKHITSVVGCAGHIPSPASLICKRSRGFVLPGDAHVAFGVETPIRTFLGPSSSSLRTTGSVLPPGLSGARGPGCTRVRGAEGDAGDRADVQWSLGAAGTAGAGGRDSRGTAPRHWLRLVTWA